MALLEVSNVSKRLNDAMELSDINFAQSKLQKIAVAGESGAGKTTLLKMITGHLQPDNGIIMFDGRKVDGPNEKLIPGHLQIGYLSQHYELHHNYKVEELIWFENKLPEKSANILFEICRIRHLLKRKTEELSGGERQRIALCMLLIKSPKLLVLDEPFSNLDLIHKNILKDVLEDIGKKLEITCMIASHEPSDILPWADEILVMKSGNIVQRGTPQQIYHQPKDKYVAGLLGRCIFLDKHQLTSFYVYYSNEKAAMLRPEYFDIVSKSEHAIKALVKKINFYGFYFEAELIANNVAIIVRTERMMNADEEVYIQLKRDKIWFIN